MTLTAGLSMTSGSSDTSVQPGLFLFTFMFKGLALGGVAVVIARDEDEARQVVFTPCGDRPELSGAPVPITHTPTIAHFDNGDY